jgi:hypothetical protein
MNREIVMRLVVNHGWRVQCRGLGNFTRVAPPIETFLQALAKTPIDEQRAAFVLAQPPGAMPWHNENNIHFTMFETQGLPSYFRNASNAVAREVWNPSQWGCKVFRDGGILKPIIHMPLGVNADQFRPGLDEPDLTYQDISSGGKKTKTLPKKFRFVALFDWHVRKGPDILIKAFCRAFQKRDDAILVIYSRLAGQQNENNDAKICKQGLEYFQQGGEKLMPPVYHCGQHVSEENLARALSNANCFVSASRGEGFCLPIIEAAACGVPVLAAANTAQTELALFTIPTPEIEPCPPEWLTLAPWFHDQKVVKMGEEVIAAFAAAMQDVIDDPKSHADVASKFRAMILRDYTWDVAARNVHERLLHIQSTPETVMQTAMEDAPAYGR